MISHAIVALVVFFGALLLLSYPLGLGLARIGDSAPFPGLAGAAERILYRLAGVRPDEEMSWIRYAGSLLAFNGAGFLLVYLIQRLQAWLPFNPDAMGNVSPDLAFNTAVSFVTNTNWQAYSGESAMSHLTQMAALTVQNFVSSATGLAVAFALMRGFARRASAGLGSFWVDLCRGTLWVLLPLSVVLAALLMGQGVIQNLSAHRDVRLIEPLTYGAPQGAETTKTQSIAMGPVASQ